MIDIHAKCSFCSADVVRRKQAKEVKRHFCNLECKAKFQRMAKPVTKEWLERTYLAEGKDCTQIARMVSRDPKSVWNWLKDFGIPTRPRGAMGGAASRAWKKGDPSKFKGKKHTDATRRAMSQLAIATGRVPYDPKVGSYMKGRRGDQTPMWKGGITPERQALYSSQEWRDAVSEVWQRDDAKCRRCGLDHQSIDRSTRKFHIHHIDSFKVVERRSDATNLVLLCDKCHRWVHGKNNKERLFLGAGH